MPKHTLQQRLYWTADKQRLVAEDDPAAAFLYAPAGAEVDAAEAERLGLTGKPPAAPAPVVVPSTAADPAPDAKATHQADVEDKAVEPPRAARKER